MRPRTPATFTFAVAFMYDLPSGVSVIVIVDWPDSLPSMLMTYSRVSAPAIPAAASAAKIRRRAQPQVRADMAAQPPLPVTGRRHAGRRHHPGRRLRRQDGIVRQTVVGPPEIVHAAIRHVRIDRTVETVLLGRRRQHLRLHRRFQVRLLRPGEGMKVL